MYTCKDHKDLELVSTYYPDLDLKIIKCPNLLCDQPSAIILEKYKAKKKKRQQELKEKEEAITNK